MKLQPKLTPFCSFQPLTESRFFAVYKIYFDKLQLRCTTLFRETVNVVHANGVFVTTNTAGRMCACRKSGNSELSRCTQVYEFLISLLHTPYAPLWGNYLHASIRKYVYLWWWY